MNRTTIAAISTPIGTGGIGIVRISGEDSVNIADQMFRSYSNKSINNISGYSGILGDVIDGEIIVDQAIVYRYIAPKSYTGEDIIEFSCHGGSFSLNKVFRLALNLGAKPAEAGEFTKRAFLNGKIDLIKAESVMDIINAQSDASVKVANDMRKGKLSTKITQIVDNIISQSAHLAAWSDYPEEDMEMVDLTILKDRLVLAEKDIKELIKSYDYGRIIKEGIPTAIVGKPNVGKSTLMNMLSGYETSIVSDIPGTTRDIVRESVRLGDLVLQISDTAGIRDTEDIIEKIGVERAKEQLKNSQLVVVIFDSSVELDEDDYSLISTLDKRNTIAIINKIDLETKADLNKIKNNVEYFIEVSVKNNTGLEKLEPMISNMLGLDRFNQGDMTIINNERQRGCLISALSALNEALEALDMGITLDAVSVCIEEALDQLLSMTGQKASEEIISQVFANFCVGK